MSHFVNSREDVSLTVAADGHAGGVIMINHDMRLKLAKL